MKQKLTRRGVLAAMVSAAVAAVMPRWARAAAVDDTWHVVTTRCILSGQPMSVYISRTDQKQRAAFKVFKIRQPGQRIIRTFDRGWTMDQAISEMRRPHSLAEEPSYTRDQIAKEAEYFGKMNWDGGRIYSDNWIGDDGWDDARAIAKTTMAMACDEAGRAAVPH